VKLKSIFILVAVLAIAGVVYLIAANQPVPEEEVEPVTYIWDFDMDALRNIEIILPKEGKSEAWVQHEDRYFYFDEENGTKVDMERWGGGIPLILSGPSAARIIYENIPESRLAEYGFVEPNILINLKLNDDATYHIVLGNSTPSGADYYIKMAEGDDVYTVDGSWYDVVSRLVTEPPYQKANYVVQEYSFIPAQPVANQPFIIRAVIANTGVLADSAANIELKFQGVLSGTFTETLEGQASVTVDFPIAGQPSGTYSVNLGGKTTKLVIP